MSEVDEFFGYPGPNELPISEAKNYEVKIVGNAEQGQKIFQQIKSSIASQPEWNFPLHSKNYLKKVKEKIKELEEKKDRPQPKEE